MDVKMINPFVVSCCEVLTTMAKLEAKVGRPALRDRTFPSFAVLAVIEITGASNGSVTFGFSATIAAALTGALLGEPRRQFDTECLDAMGEVANMIAGSAKKNLPGGLCTISTPKVCLDRRQLEQAKPPVVYIPCFTDEGQFDIEVSLHQRAVVKAANSAAA